MILDRVLADENLHSNPGIFFFSVRRIHQSAGDTVRHLIRVARIYFLKHGFTPSLHEQSLIRSSWGRNLPVIGAAVFLHDLEDLVPEPHRLVHVINAMLMNGDGIGFWVVGCLERSPCGWSSLTLNPAALHMAYRSNSWGDTFAAQPTFFNHSQVSV